MSAAAWEAQPKLLDHQGPWTEDDYLSLPETTWPRVELLDGGLLMSPAPNSDHQTVARRLANLLESAVRVRQDSRVLEGVNVRLTASNYFIPDVVISRQLQRLTFYDAAQIVLVAEIVSPSTVGTDRLLKPDYYARAGIAWYLRVELEESTGPEVIVFHLKDGTYIEHVRAHAGQELRLKEPVEVAFDPATLLDVW